MSIEITVGGNAGERLDAIPGELDRALVDAGWASGLKVETTGKHIAPVDTGFYRATVGVERPEHVGYALVTRVGSPAEYAPFIRRDRNLEAALERNIPAIESLHERLIAEVVD